MKCNPWRWFWGLPLVLALGWLMQLTGVFSGIETDLKRRTEAELNNGGQPWATINFSGRDGTLVGQAVDKSDQLRAAGLARANWGTRIVDDQSRLLDEEKNYVWAAQLQSDGKVRLTGFVPTQVTRAAIIGAAKATFPSRDIDDRMKLARGAPPTALWEGGISFALKQLAALKAGGRVDLEAANLLIEGEAADINTYTTVKSALQSGLPQGVRLRSDKVTPPVVKPYTWSAKQSGNQVVLSGYVPQRARDEIFAAAKRAYPRLAVVDRMQIAAGEPKDWLQAVLGAITHMAPLEEGSVDFRDGQYSIAGLAADEAAADRVRRGLRSDVPAAFKPTEALRIKEVPLKTIDPFTTGISMANGVVTLTGFVPSPAARLALVDAVKSRLGGQRIDDKLEVAIGAPEEWQRCVLAGVGGIGRLGGGRVLTSGKSMSLTGATDDEALSQSLPGEVQGMAGGGCATDVKINFTGISAAELKRRADAAAADAAARKAAADEAARKTAVDDAARKAAADEAARKAAAEEASRKAAADEAARKATADEATRKAAAEEASRKAAADDAARKAAAQRQSKAEAESCQVLLRKVRDEGVINFKRASADLDQASNATLNQIVQVMSTCQSARIEIQGHTDAEGTPERNANLSNRRAKSVLDYLIAAGADGTRLTAVGYGETQPIAANDTPVNRAKNRRIEFEVKAE